MEVLLSRFWESSERTTLGVLIVDGMPICTTLELPWLGNEARRSCIPSGFYEAKRTKDRTLEGGTKIQETFEVEVPHRSGILFHVGNKSADTLGCVLLGMSFRKFDDEIWVVSSKLAFIKFLRAMDGIHNFTLRVTKPA